MKQTTATRHAAALRYMRDKAEVLSVCPEDAYARSFLLQAIAIYTQQPEDVAAVSPVTRRDNTHFMLIESEVTV